MNNLSDFVEYDGEALADTHPVLVWSRATGYYFTEMKFIASSDLKVVARLK